MMETDNKPQSDPQQEQHSFDELKQMAKDLRNRSSETAKKLNQLGVQTREFLSKSTHDEAAQDEDKG